MNTTKLSRAGMTLALLALLLALVGPAWAQTPVAIAVGENKTGEVSATAPVVVYALEAATAQTVTVQVLGLTAGFAPNFRVLAPNGAVLQTAAPVPGASVAVATVPLTTPGAYQISVSSGSGQAGQFVLSVQGGTALPPAIPLVLGQLQAGALTAQTPITLFTFTALPTDNAVVVVRAEGSVGAPATGGPLVQLRDQETNEVLGMATARLIGASFRVPLGTVSYLLQVTHSGAGLAEPFTVCLESETGSIRCPGSQSAPPPTAIVLAPTITPVPPTRIPPVAIPPGAVCSVASSVGTAVNVRSGPNTTFPIVTQLPVTSTAAVMARLPDSSWYQVNVSGIIGWISGTVVVIGGQCAALPSVTLTPLAPTATVIPAASSTPTVTQTPTPTATATMPEPEPTLNFSLPPVFGSTSLTSGFVPDPFTAGVTGGGPANAASLGGTCAGFTTSAPSFSVNYTSGSFPLLRFYFVGSGDSTMVINAPNGSFFCVDDSFGTVNPAIDFNTPASGRYDVWIGTFSAGGSIGGTLNVTENSGNHP